MGRRSNTLFYSQLADATAALADWGFMNYGIAEPEAPALGPESCSILLYQHLASAVPLAGKKVLEIGSGRGGGAAWVHQTFSPEYYLGVDRTAAVVALAKSRGAPGLEFRAGDAEHLALADETFDVVLNVESAHCYENMARFVGEVARVLRPGGYFLFTDFFRNPAEQETFREALRTHGLAIQREQDITAKVVAALDQTTTLKKEIQRRLPENLQQRFGEFAAMQGSLTYYEFVGRSLVYWSFVSQKV